ncbi:MAG: SAM-dependent methyltransferase [Ruminiclostridium sp.]|nr:SAM-dependent methyltransferase [Ruminiclostridium sp.]
MIRLDDRLAAVASFVRTDRRICDVGTDHALLPCFLCEQGARDVIASDVNEMPLEAARANVEKYGFSDRIRLIRSDGLADIPPCDDVIVAGMGGELIARIVGGCTFVTADTRFILQPMTRAEHLRRFLYANGFEITEEKGAYSAGKAYTVVLAVYTGEKREISDEFAYFGKCGDPRYIKKVNGQLEKLGRSDPSLLSIIRKEQP